MTKLKPDPNSPHDPQTCICAGCSAVRGDKIRNARVEPSVCKTCGKALKMASQEPLITYIACDCVEQGGEFVKELKQCIPSDCMVVIRNEGLKQKIARQAEEYGELESKHIKCGIDMMVLYEEIKQLQAQIARLEGALKDTRLELACPETMNTEKEELYKVAALVVCEQHRIQAELKKVRLLLRDALPNIECKDNSQSGLITAIGEYLQALKEKTNDQV